MPFTNIYLLKMVMWKCYYSWAFMSEIIHGNNFNLNQICYDQQPASFWTTKYVTVKYKLRLFCDSKDHVFLAVYWWASCICFMILNFKSSDKLINFYSWFFSPMKIIVLNLLMKWVKLCNIYNSAKNVGVFIDETL